MIPLAKIQNFCKIEVMCKMDYTKYIRKEYDYDD